MKKKITLSLGKIFVSDTARQLLLLHLRVAAASRVSNKKRIHSCLFTWGLTGSISQWFCFILLKQSVMHIYQFHFNQKPASPFSSFTYYALSLPFPSSRNTWKILTKIVSISSNRSIKLSKVPVYSLCHCISHSLFDHLLSLLGKSQPRRSPICTTTHRYQYLCRCSQFALLYSRSDSTTVPLVDAKLSGPTWCF